MMALATLGWASTSAGKSAACARAEAEMGQARQVLSNAIRDADARAAAYQSCVEGKDREHCKDEERALHEALKTKRDAKAAYRYAAERAKQVCGG